MALELDFLNVVVLCFADEESDVAESNDINADLSISAKFKRQQFKGRHWFIY
jgi:hypothetical protein